LSSIVCIFQHGMYFPAWYFLAGYVLSSMVCIVQHVMYWVFNEIFAWNTNNFVIYHEGNFEFRIWKKKNAIIASHTNKQITYWIKWTIHTYFLAGYVLSSMVCIVQHVMYCPAWYVFFSMVCIFQNGMYFPAGLN
jgi:hypothetical protein